jgi:hypothetical protein
MNTALQAALGELFLDLIAAIGAVGPHVRSGVARIENTFELLAVVHVRAAHPVTAHGFVPAIDADAVLVTKIRPLMFLRPTGVLVLLAVLGQGSESGLTRKLAEQGCEILWVPSGPLSPEFDASFVLGSTQEVDGKVADDGHVFRAVSTSKAGLVVFKRHVENPVKAVLDGPVAAHGLGGAGGVERGGRDVVACLETAAIS